MNSLNRDKEKREKIEGMLSYWGADGINIFQIEGKNCYTGLVDDILQLVQEAKAEERKRCLVEVADWAIQRQIQTVDMSDRDYLIRQAGYLGAIGDLRVFLDQAISAINN